eukprot:4430172-Pyramimonas_sp.AAC.1
MALAQLAPSMGQPFSPSAWSFAVGLPLARQFHRGPTFAFGIRKQHCEGAGAAIPWVSVGLERVAAPSSSSLTATRTAVPFARGFEFRLR